MVSLNLRACSDCHVSLIEALLISSLVGDPRTLLRTRENARKTWPMTSEPTTSTSTSIQSQPPLLMFSMVGAIGCRGSGPLEVALRKIWHCRVRSLASIHSTSACEETNSGTINRHPSTESNGTFLLVCPASTYFSRSARGRSSTRPGLCKCKSSFGVCEYSLSSVRCLPHGNTKRLPRRFIRERSGWADQILVNRSMRHSEAI